MREKDAVLHSDYHAQKAQYHLDKVNFHMSMITHWKTANAVFDSFHNARKGK